MFTIRHLVSRAQVGVVLYSLFVLGTALELPLLAVDGIVEGVVGGVRCFDDVQLVLHVWEQRLESHRVQSSFRTCPLSLLLGTMLLHRQPERVVVRALDVWRTGESLGEESFTACFDAMSGVGDDSPAPTSTFAWHDRR